VTVDAPLALAFTAGMVATVNPCGFAMLPAYLSWFVGVDGGDEAELLAVRLTRALWVSALVSLSFVVVFAAAGVLVTAGALVVIDVVPWLAALVGVGLVVMGVAMLRGWKPMVAVPQPTGGVRGRGAGGVVLFGASYALASLSCTLPVFLAVVAGTVTRTDLFSGVATFIAYGVGMSLVLVAVAGAVASAQSAVVARLRRASRHVERVAAVLLIVAGLYVAGYWAFVLAVPPGSAGQPGWAVIAGWPVSVVDRISSWAVDHVQRWVTPIAVALGATVLAVLWKARARHRDERPTAGAAAVTRNENADQEERSNACPVYPSTPSRPPRKRAEMR
jgi:cytochrome c-type biogenesis protein